jgi:hypothetical protein
LLRIATAFALVADALLLCSVAQTEAASIHIRDACDPSSTCKKARLNE